MNSPFFRWWCVPADPMTGFINIYNVRTNANLALQMLDQKFLQANDLEDMKQFFVANLHEIYHLSPLNSTRMIDNDYSRLKMVDTLFNLSLIVDQTLEYRFASLMSERSMANAIYCLALHNGWITKNQCNDPGKLIGKLNPNPNVGLPDQTPLLF